MKAQHIALCGIPGSGKSEVQRILKEEFGTEPIDDGRSLRDCAKRCYGLSEWHVTTQEGKKSWVDVCGTHKQVRVLLGELGNFLEAAHGEGIQPTIAMRDAANVLAFSYSYGSVRKKQGWHYKRAVTGGIVVEIVRPGREETGNDFDLYDKNAVDVVIMNDGSIADLVEKVKRQVGPLIRQKGQAFDVTD